MTGWREGKTWLIFPFVHSLVPGQNRVNKGILVRVGTDPGRSLATCSLLRRVSWRGSSPAATPAPRGSPVAAAGWHQVPIPALGPLSLAAASGLGTGGPISTLPTTRPPKGLASIRTLAPVRVSGGQEGTRRRAASGGSEFLAPVCLKGSRVGKESEEGGCKATGHAQKRVLLEEMAGFIQTGCVPFARGQQLMDSEGKAEGKERTC